MTVLNDGIVAGVEVKHMLRSEGLLGYSSAGKIDAASLRLCGRLLATIPPLGLGIGDIR